MFDFKNLKNLLKKEEPEITGIEKAKDLGLITEEEFLRLKESRATEELKQFYDRQKSKK